MAPDLLSAPTARPAPRRRHEIREPRRTARELCNRILRELPEAGSRLPSLNEAGSGRLCESGARAAAEDGLIEEEDLPLLDARPGDADALGRRALAAGPREWAGGSETRTQVGDRDPRHRGRGEPGTGGGSPRHRRQGRCGRPRTARARRPQGADSGPASEDFGATPDLPAAPAESGEAQDLLAALYAAANFADARAARTVWMLRRVLGEAAGGLDIRAAWRVGGIEEQDGRLVHRRGLALVEDGDALVCGSYAAAGTGNMWSSAPPFGVPEDEGRWPWEEAGLLERLAALDPPEG